MKSLGARLRTVSRIALYGSLALVAVLAGLLLLLASGPLTRETEPGWELRDYGALEEVRLLQEYVRIDTSEATGDLAAAARFLAGLLREAGIEPHVEVLGTGDVNLWAVLEGEEPGAVVLHHHMDVEDVAGQGTWRHPPFEAAIELPYLYGRGTFDMKSVGIAQLLALIDLAESGVPPRRSVVYLATAGEETGSDLGTRWVLREHPELVERFELVLTEGGVLEARNPESIKYWGTEFAQKRYVEVVACDPSRQRLEAIARDIREHELDRQLALVDEIQAFLPHYAPTRDARWLREALSEPDRILRDRPLFERLPGYVQAMFRNELHVLEVAPAAGDGFELRASAHLLPGVTLEEALPRLLPDWLFHGVPTTVYTEPSADHGSPLDHPVLEAIEATLRESYPGVQAGPILLPWTATDSRFFRAHGVPSYGFTPFTIFTTDALRGGSAGERIGLPGYVAGVEIYRRLLRRLVS